MNRERGSRISLSSCQSLMGSQGVSAWIKQSHSAEQVPASHLGHVSCLHSSLFHLLTRAAKARAGNPQLVHSCCVLSLSEDSLALAGACFDSQFVLWLDLHWLPASSFPQFRANTHSEQGQHRRYQKDSVDTGVSSPQHPVCVVSHGKVSRIYPSPYFSKSASKGNSNIISLVSLSQKFPTLAFSEKILFCTGFRILNLGVRECRGCVLSLSYSPSLRLPLDFGRRHVQELVEDVGNQHTGPVYALAGLRLQSYSYFP